jgi:hypothetical protein
VNAITEPSHSATSEIDELRAHCAELQAHNVVLLSYLEEHTEQAYADQGGGEYEEEKESPFQDDY